ASRRTIRFLHVDAQQHVLLLPRVGRVDRELVELVSVLEARRAETLGQWAVWIVHLDHLLLRVVRARPAAHHLGELRPVVIGKRDCMVPADSSALPYETKNALPDFGI